MVEELWLTFLSRPAKPDEMKTALEFVKKAKTRREGVEDVAWALLNTKEFMFNH